jgi:outer membrane murein-binding lipoprotein Lpp
MLNCRLRLMGGLAAVLCALLVGCNNTATNTLIDALSSAGQTLASAIVKAFFQTVGNAG